MGGPLLLCWWSLRWSRFLLLSCLHSSSWNESKSHKDVSTDIPQVELKYRDSRSKDRALKVVLESNTGNKWIIDSNISGADSSVFRQIDLWRHSRHPRIPAAKLFKISNSSIEIEHNSPTLKELFVDKPFSSLLNTFRNREAYRRRTSFRSGPTPKVYVVSTNSLSTAYWNESLKQFTDDLCPFKCNFVDSQEEINSADAVLIQLNFFKNIASLKSELPIRDPSQPWIVFSVESPTNLNFKLDDTVNGLFNRTMTYRTDSDVVFYHGFIVSKEDARILPPSWVQTSQIEETSFEARKLAVAFISHCHTMGGRMKYIKELEKYMKVDLYGRCGSLKCGSSRVQFTDLKFPALNLALDSHFRLSILAPNLCPVLSVFMIKSASREDDGITTLEKLLPNDDNGKIAVPKDYYKQDVHRHVADYWSGGQFTAFSYPPSESEIVVCFEAHCCISK
ncbi:Fucosyltransferase N-terminal [Trinorchestia longiramus]|nr:Fucosyltransferase N-terminal [Trinorchestia longiramus]